MSTVITIGAFTILFLTAICVYRLIVGKTLFDRAIGASLIGNNAVLIMIFTGFMFDRIDMFVDIAIAYALLNFVIAIVLGKYFERRSKKTQ